MELREFINDEVIQFNFDIKPIQERLHLRDRKPSSRVQLLVKFVHHIHYQYINLSYDDLGHVHETLILESDEETKEESCLFDMDALKNNYQESYMILSDTLTLFGIERGDPVNDRMVNKIIESGFEIGNKVWNMGRKVLGLCVYIRRDHYKYRCERCIVNTVLRESMEEFERLMNSNNKGIMVPASDSAIKKVLKKVIVGTADDKLESSCGHVKEESRERKKRNISVSDDVKEEGRERKRRRSSGSDHLKEEGGERKRKKVSASEGESCTVCMEEFEAGSAVACMPCSHVFHGKCIVKWLRQSHYCPVCRYEVPTD